MPERISGKRVAPASTLPLEPLFPTARNRRPSRTRIHRREMRRPTRCGGSAASSHLLGPATRPFRHGEEIRAHPLGRDISKSSAAFSAVPMPPLALVKIDSCYDAPEDRNLRRSVSLLIVWQPVARYCFVVNPSFGLLERRMLLCVLALEKFYLEG